MHQKCSAILKKPKSHFCRQDFTSQTCQIRLVYKSLKNSRHFELKNTLIKNGSFTFQNGIKENWWKIMHGSKGFELDFQWKINDQKKSKNTYSKHLYDQRNGLSRFSAFLTRYNCLKTSLKVTVFDAILMNNCLLSSDCAIHTIAVMHWKVALHYTACGIYLFVRYKQIKVTLTWKTRCTYCSIRYSTVPTMHDGA